MIGAVEALEDAKAALNDHLELAQDQMTSQAVDAYHAQQTHEHFAVEAAAEADRARRCRIGAGGCPRHGGPQG